MEKIKPWGAFFKTGSFPKKKFGFLNGPPWGVVGGARWGGFFFFGPKKIYPGFGFFWWGKSPEKKGVPNTYREKFWGKKKFTNNQQKKNSEKRAG